MIDHRIQRERERAAGIDIFDAMKISLAPSYNDIKGGVVRKGGGRGSRCGGRHSSSCRLTSFIIRQLIERYITHPRFSTGVLIIPSRSIRFLTYEII